MLRGQEADSALDLGHNGVRFTYGLNMGGLLRRWGQGNIALIPPIQLGNVLDTTAGEPRLNTKWGKEMAIRMFFGNFHDARI